MYWHICDLSGPANLVASTVVELDDTLPYLTDVQWDSVGATDRSTRVRWASLDSLIVLVDCGRSWCLCGSRVSRCQVIFPCRVVY
jgi:hypothetical protein